MINNVEKPQQSVSIKIAFALLSVFVFLSVLIYVASFSLPPEFKDHGLFLGHFFTLIALLIVCVLFSI